MESSHLKEDVNLPKNDEIVLINEAVMQRSGGGDDIFSVPNSKLKAALNKKGSISIAPKARMKRNTDRRIDSCASQSELCLSSSPSNSQLTTKELQLSVNEISEEFIPSFVSTSIPIATASVNSPDTTKAVARCRQTLPHGITCSVAGIDKNTSIKLIPLPPAAKLGAVDDNHLTLNRNLSNGRVWRYAGMSKFSTKQSITLTPLKDIRCSSENSKQDHETPKFVQKRPNMETFALCKSCGHCNRDFTKCEKCNAVNIGKKPMYENIKVTNVLSSPSASASSTNDKNTIPKQIFYNLKLKHPESPKEDHSENLHNYTGNAFVMPESSIPKRRPRVAKRKDVEPECLTISSDEEENTNHSGSLTTTDVTATPVNSTQHNEMIEGNDTFSEVKENTVDQLISEHVCHHDHSANAVGSSFEDPDAEEDEMDKVTEEEEDEEEEMDIDEEEDEEEDHEHFAEDEEEEDETGLNTIEKEFDITILCRSIRIGSFKIHTQNNSFLHVNVNGEGFSFSVPTVTSGTEIVNIQLKPKDIIHTLGHFGRCLPILFIYANSGCGGIIRSKLHMNKSDGVYFDPTEIDEKQKRITFLIESITDEHRVFLRHIFPGESLLREIDQKTANEILVRSTPTKPLSSKCHQAILHASVHAAAPQTPTQSPTVTTAVAVTNPVVKLLTYPPPPQTGGIAITNEDMLCLNEGEFLNDVIIDFYLKYLVNEKLSEVDLQRIHVFSSFFYPRLTQKPTGKPPPDEEKPSLSVRRHGQVKTWTRHVDIFEKDFIIIPINQNAHWFLAIICFPGLVPESSNIPPNPSSPQMQKSVNNVSSSNDPDSSQTQLLLHQKNFHVPKKEQACNTEGLSTNSTDIVSSISTSCSTTVTAFDHEVAEPYDPEDPLAEVPDSSTHPDVDVHGKENVQFKDQKIWNPCIMIFDSLAGPTRWRIVNVLREYLDVEWKIKKSSVKTFDRSTIPGYIPKVPQQSNFSDCGLFLLQYVETLFENPLPHFGSPMPELNDWFAPEKVANKREQLKLLISELQKIQLPLGTPSNNIGNRVLKEPENKSPCETVIIPLQTIKLQNR